LRDRIAAEESGFHRAAGISPRQRNAAIAAALSLVVVLGAVLFLARDRNTNATPQGIAAPQPARQYLAVTRFKDLTGETRGQLVVDGFAETLATRLAGYPAVQVMRAANAPAAPLDAAAIARDLGANLVLTGSMMRAGDRIRVAWTVVEPRSGREWRNLVEGSADDLFAVQDRVAGDVARELGLGVSTLQVARDPAVSQQQYLEALGHMRRYDSDESLDAAIAILDQLGASPSVQAALARAYLHKFQNSREPQFAASATRAAERALEGDPQSVDVNVTVGELRRQTGRYPEAMESYLRALSQQPNNADAILGLAETYKAAGDVPKAEAAYRRAIALQPNWWGGYNKLGAFYYINGRYADAVPLFQKVLELVPDNERGYNNLGGMYQRLGRYDDAVRVFEQSIARVPSPAGYSNLGTCYYFLGRFGDAARAFEKATELAPHNYIYRRNLGDALRWIPGQEAAARDAFERAIDLCDDAIRVNPSDAGAHISRAAALAKTGRTREARAAILRALELEPRDPTGAYEAAVVANISGAPDESVARLEQAVRLGWNADDIPRDPEFANLAKTGRLASIVQSPGK
jgi:tetratricopeptide (TPR) repeat protein